MPICALFSAPKPRKIQVQNCLDAFKIRQKKNFLENHSFLIKFICLALPAKVKRCGWIDFFFHFFVDFFFAQIFPASDREGED